MIEETRRINNPLNLIKIFLWLPIGLLFATRFIKEENQFVVICFVMAYVLLLTLLTFVIWKPALLAQATDAINLTDDRDATGYFIAKLYV